MIINSTYFINEIFIAGQANSVDIDSSRSQLTGFINKYEPKFLTELLGATLYSELIAGLGESVPEQKWIGLRDELANDDTKESPIANYVYYWFIRNQVTMTVGVGEVTPLAENAINANSVNKQVRAWNDMVDMNKKVIIFLNENINDYPSYEPKCPLHFGYKYGNYLLCRGYELLQHINSLNI